MYFIRRTMWTMILCSVGLGAVAQTQVDVERQARGVDFLRPPFAMPLRQGETLPATCETNELFFLTTAPAGGNIHVCHATDSWAPQGSAEQGFVTVMNDSSPVGVRSTINFVPGQGLGQIVTDLGSQVNVQQSLDTALLLTQTRAQSGEVLLCLSTDGSGSAYSCAMAPSLQSLDAGMVVHWIPDVDNAGGTATLSIDAFPAVPLRLADGQATPRAGDFVAGRLFPLWYDGAVFRALQSPLVENLQTVEAHQAGTAIFCDAESIEGSDFSCGLHPPLQAYVSGMVLLWRPDQDSSGETLTLAVDALTARPLKRADGTGDFAEGELRGGSSYWLWYDGAQFRVASFLPAGLVTIPALQAQLATIQSGEATRCASADSNGNVFACALNPALSSYSAGLVLSWEPDEDASGGAATLNVDALGAIPIKRADGVADPQALEFRSGRMYPLWFDGLQFRLPPVEPVPSAVTVDNPRPACTEGLRGKLWLTPGGEDVADLFAVCMKDALNAFDWRPLLP